MPSSTPAVSSLSPPQQLTSSSSDPVTGYDVDDDLIGEEDDTETQLFFEPEDPTYCELSFVRLVEEDYFHFLSNLFAYICQTETIN